jgi:type II secretory pathway component PulF
MVLQMEKGTRAEQELRLWQERIKNGETKFSNIAQDARVFPDLFIWIVASYGEGMCTGFSQAAKFYYARAEHQIQLMLYGVMPASVLLLGLMLLGQIVSMIHGYILPLVQFMQMLD